MRRFEQRPGETLVLAEILDRKVDLVPNGDKPDAGRTAEQVTVIDAGMEQDRTRDWEITQVFVRRGRQRASAAAARP